MICTLTNNSSQPPDAVGPVPAPMAEVIREALRQWKERRELHGHTVEELRLLWDEGLRSGDPQPLSDTFVDRIRTRGRAQRAEADKRS